MLRIAILYIAGIEALLFIFLGVLSLLDGGSSPAVASIARLAAMLCIFGVAPALVLAVLNRLLPLALLLTVLVLPFAAYGLSSL